MTKNIDTAILVVDDEEFIRRMVARILLEKGYRCTLAESGQAALDLLATQPFSLIVTDLMLSLIHI